MTIKNVYDLLQILFRQKTKSQDKRHKSKLLIYDIYLKRYVTADNLLVPSPAKDVIDGRNLGGKRNDFILWDLLLEKFINPKLDLLIPPGVNNKWQIYNCNTIQGRHASSTSKDLWEKKRREKMARNVPALPSSSENEQGTGWAGQVLYKPETSPKPEKSVMYTANIASSDSEKKKRNKAKSVTEKEKSEKAAKDPISHKISRIQKICSQIFKKSVESEGQENLNELPKLAKEDNMRMNAKLEAQINSYSDISVVKNYPAGSELKSNEQAHQAVPRNEKNKNSITGTVDSLDDNLENVLKANHKHDSSLATNKEKNPKKKIVYKNVKPKVKENIVVVQNTEGSEKKLITKNDYLESLVAKSLKKDDGMKLNKKSSENQKNGDYLVVSKKLIVKNDENIQNLTSPKSEETKHTNSHNVNIVSNKTETVLSENNTLKKNKVITSLTGSTTKEAQTRNTDNGNGVSTKLETELSENKIVKLNEDYNKLTDLMGEETKTINTDSVIIVPNKTHTKVSETSKDPHVDIKNDSLIQNSKTEDQDSSKNIRLNGPIYENKTDIQNSGKTRLEGKYIKNDKDYKHNYMEQVSKLAGIPSELKKDSEKSHLANKNIHELKNNVTPKMKLLKDSYLNFIFAPIRFKNNKNIENTENNIKTRKKYKSHSLEPHTKAKENNTVVNTSENSSESNSKNRSHSAIKKTLKSKYIKKDLLKNSSYLQNKVLSESKDCNDNKKLQCREPKSTEKLQEVSAEGKILQGLEHNTNMRKEFKSHSLDRRPTIATEKITGINTSEISSVSNSENRSHAAIETPIKSKYAKEDLLKNSSHLKNEVLSESKDCNDSNKPHFMEPKSTEKLQEVSAEVKISQGLKNNIDVRTKFKSQSLDRRPTIATDKITGINTSEISSLSNSKHRSHSAIENPLKSKYAEEGLINNSSYLKNKVLSESKNCNGSEKTHYTKPKSTEKLYEVSAERKILQGLKNEIDMRKKFKSHSLDRPPTIATDKITGINTSEISSVSNSENRSHPAVEKPLKSKNAEGLLKKSSYLTNKHLPESKDCNGSEQNHIEPKTTEKLHKISAQDKILQGLENNFNQGTKFKSHSLGRTLSKSTEKITGINNSKINSESNSESRSLTAIEKPLKSKPAKEGLLKNSSYYQNKVISESKNCNDSEKKHYIEPKSTKKLHKISAQDKILEDLENDINTRKKYKSHSLNRPPNIATENISGINNSEISSLSNSANRSHSATEKSLKSKYAKEGLLKKSSENKVPPESKDYNDSEKNHYIEPKPSKKLLEITAQGKMLEGLELDGELNMYNFKITNYKGFKIKSNNSETQITNRTSPEDNSVLKQGLGKIGEQSKSVDEALGKFTALKTQEKVTEMKISSSNESKKTEQKAISTKKPILKGLGRGNIQAKCADKPVTEPTFPKKPNELIKIDDLEKTKKLEKNNSQKQEVKTDGLLGNSNLRDNTTGASLIFPKSTAFEDDVQLETTKLDLVAKEILDGKCKIIRNKDLSNLGNNCNQENTTDKTSEIPSMLKKPTELKEPKKETTEQNFTRPPILSEGFGRDNNNSIKFKSSGRQEPEKHAKNTVLMGKSVDLGNDVKLNGTADKALEKPTELKGDEFNESKNETHSNLLKQLKEESLGRKNKTKTTKTIGKLTSSVITENSEHQNTKQVEQTKDDKSWSESSRQAMISCKALEKSTLLQEHTELTNDISHMLNEETKADITEKPKFKESIELKDHKKDVEQLSQDESLSSNKKKINETPKSSDTPPESTPTSLQMESKNDVENRDLPKQSKLKAGSVKIRSHSKSTSMNLGKPSTFQIFTELENSELHENIASNDNRERNKLETTSKIKSKKLKPIMSQYLMKKPKKLKNLMHKEEVKIISQKKKKRNLNLKKQIKSTKIEAKAKKRTKGFGTVPQSVNDETSENIYRSKSDPVLSKGKTVSKNENKQERIKKILKSSSKVNLEKKPTGREDFRSLEKANVKTQGNVMKRQGTIKKTIPSFYQSNFNVASEILTSHNGINSDKINKMSQSLKVESPSSKKTKSFNISKKIDGTKSTSELIGVDTYRKENLKNAKKVSIFSKTIHKSKAGSYFEQKYKRDTEISGHAQRSKSEPQAIPVRIAFPNELKKERKTKRNNSKLNNTEVCSIKLVENKKASNVKEQASKDGNYATMANSANQTRRTPQTVVKQQSGNEVSKHYIQQTVNIHKPTNEESSSKMKAREILDITDQSLSTGNKERNNDQSEKQRIGNLGNKTKIAASIKMEPEHERNSGINLPKTPNNLSHLKNEIKNDSTSSNKIYLKENLNVKTEPLKKLSINKSQLIKKSENPEKPKSNSPLMQDSKRPAAETDKDHILAQSYSEVNSKYGSISRTDNHRDNLSIKHNTSKDKSKVLSSLSSSQNEIKDNVCENSSTNFKTKIKETNTPVSKKEVKKSNIDKLSKVLDTPPGGRRKLSSLSKSALSAFVNIKEDKLSSPKSNILSENEKKPSQVGKSLQTLNEMRLENLVKVVGLKQDPIKCGSVKNATKILMQKESLEQRECLKSEKNTSETKNDFNHINKSHLEHKKEKTRLMGSNTKSGIKKTRIKESVAKEQYNTNQLREDRNEKKSEERQPVTLNFKDKRMNRQFEGEQNSGDSKRGLITKGFDLSKADNTVKCAAHNGLMDMMVKNAIIENDKYNFAPKTKEVKLTNQETSRKIKRSIAVGGRKKSDAPT